MNIYTTKSQYLFICDEIKTDNRKGSVRPKRKRTKDQYVKMFNDKHGNKFDYSNSYITLDSYSLDKITIICRIHANFNKVLVNIYLVTVAENVPTLH